MKKTAFMLILLLVMASTVTAGTLAMYTTSVDNLAQGSIAAKEFIFTGEGAESFEQGVKIAPGETVSWQFNVKNYAGSIITETDLYYKLTFDVHASTGKSPIAPLRFTIKDESGAEAGSATGMGLIEVLGEFPLSMTGQSETYLVEVYWPSDGSHDIDYAGGGFGTSVSIHALASQMPLSGTLPTPTPTVTPTSEPTHTPAVTVTPATPTATATATPAPTPTPTVTPTSEPTHTPAVTATPVTPTATATATPAPTATPTAPTPTATPTPQAGSISVLYQTTKSWQNGQSGIDEFNYSITITNHSDQPVNGWYMEFMLNGDKLTNVWSNAKIVGKSAGQYRFVNPGYNNAATDNILPGQSVTFGGHGLGLGTTAPSGVQVGGNGTASYGATLTTRFGSLG